jgi:TusA-related sulfurtransferase
MRSTGGHDYDFELDMRNVRCPVTLTRLNEGMAAVAVGGVVRATATDPGCDGDVRAWAKLTGNEVLAILDEGTDHVLYVRRTA